MDGAFEPFIGRPLGGARGIPGLRLLRRTSGLRRGDAQLERREPALGGALAGVGTWTRGTRPLVSAPGGHRGHRTHRGRRRCPVPFCADRGAFGHRLAETGRLGSRCLERLVSTSEKFQNVNLLVAFGSSGIAVMIEVSHFLATAGT